MQISTLIGKPVLSPGGTAYGYVTDVRLTRNFEKISCFVCADEEEEEFYLPLRTVSAMQDALIAGKARLQAPAGIPSPIGKSVFTSAGEACGTVSDVILADEPHLAIVGEAGQTVPVSRAVVGEHVILYPSGRARTAAARAKTGAPSKKRTPKGNKREPAPPAQAPVFPPTEPPAAPPVLPEPGTPPTPVQDTPPTPVQGVRLNRSNLLGRHVRRTVYDGSGLPIAVAGERITPSILLAARRAGKLLELTACTLTARS